VRSLAKTQSKDCLMNLSRLQKLFGVGPIGADISLLLLAVAAWADRLLGHPTISTNAELMKVAGSTLVVIGLGLHFFEPMDNTKLVGKGSVMHDGAFQLVSSPDVRRLDHLCIIRCGSMLKLLDFSVLGSIAA